MQPVTITLDGREVSGYPGMSILNLARESGVDIPTLCHDPHLAPIGACRICLVEDERTNALMASCVTPIAPGMIIKTHSPRVIEHRKTIIKLVLASHPDSCLVCDKGNRCQLRQIAADMGIGLVELQRIPQTATIEEVNPFIQRDLSKCILCAKCIRACHELVVEGAIDYFHRGFTARPATTGNLPLENSECTFCGTCVALCPTGALSEKDKTYTGTTKTAVQTTCPFCGCGCSISLEVKDNHLVRVMPGRENENDHGTLCVRGSYGCDFIHSPDRLTGPLVKINGALGKASWENALERVAAEFQRIKGKYGPDSLAVIGSSRCTNEDNYVLQRFARSVLGTNNIYNGGHLYAPATQAGTGSSIEIPGTNSLNALEQSEVIIVIGAETTSSAPLVGYAIKRAVKQKGAKLILIDPRRTKLSPFAHLWLRPAAGTDIALLNSMAKVIIDEGLIDKESASREADNFKSFTGALRKYSLEYAKTITGIPSEEIRTAAGLYGKAKQATIIYGSGITRYSNATGAIKALVNLAYLTGKFRHKAGSIYALQRENNGQGAADMGMLPDFLPGYQSVADAQGRRIFEERWQSSLPSNPGLTFVEVIQHVKEGRIKGLYILGENPVLSLPGPAAEALGSLDFLVVQDMFLTETAKLAGVVLPAASFAEKEGTFTNFEGRVNRVRKAIEPHGESLPDWEIVLRLADRMKHPLPFSSLQQVMVEIEELVPQYKGYANLQRLSEAEIPLIEEKRTSSGQQELKEGAGISMVEYTVQIETVKHDYPLSLLTGSELYQFGTGTRSSRSSRLNKWAPEAFLEIGESDARRLGISQNDKLRVISPAAELTATARITDTLPEGTVFLPRSFPESPVARLFDISIDPQTKIPSIGPCNVRIERIAPNG